MDILNKLPSKKFEAADDLLAFISIYDDKRRTQAYKKMMRENISSIKGKVCVEAGAGLGIMSEYLVKLGAKKVYAVEVNPHLYKLCLKRLSKYKNVEVVKKDIRDFKPTEKIDLVLHELFGQLLLDEDLHVLHQLQFKPSIIMPESASLKYGTVRLPELNDALITHDILRQLGGVLTSGLFDPDGLKTKSTILEWQCNKPFPRQAKIKLRNPKHDVMFFGIEVKHRNKIICRSEECNNWSYVWTPVKSKSFLFDFKKRNDRLMEPKFEWL